MKKLTHYYYLIFLAILLLIFALISLTVSLVQHHGDYATSPASEWIWLGGLTSNRVEFRVRTDAESRLLVVSENPDLTDPVYTTALLTRTNDVNLETDKGGGANNTSSSQQHNIQAITATGLQPDTVYYYGVVASSSLLRGKFHTPAPAGTRWNFTIAVSGDAQTGSTHKVFDEVAAHDPALFVHLGDIHYQDINSNDLSKRLDAIATVLASPSQANLYRNTALVYMWDDHDWLGNNAGGYDEDEPGARDTALQSYHIAFPHYPLVAAIAAQAETSSSSINTTTNTTAYFPTYQAFTIGTVRFILSDLRSEATDDQMYSVEQHNWLLNELGQAAKYDFVVWITTKPWVGPKNNKRSKDDSWMRHVDARRELSQSIASIIGDDGPQNFLALSADSHMLAFDDGTNTFYGNRTSDADDGAVVKYSFPILVSSPLDQYGSAKGGPFTEGCTTVKYERNHQYSTIAFEFPQEAAGEACMEIKAYRVGFSKKKLIFTKRLCGKIFNQAAVTREERVGSCDIQMVSTASNALFWTALGITLVESILLILLSLCYWRQLSKTEAMIMSVMIGAGFGITFAFGVVIKTEYYYPYSDRLPTMILLTVQSFVVGMYLLLYYYQKVVAGTSSSKDKTPVSSLIIQNQEQELKQNGTSNNEEEEETSLSHQEETQNQEHEAKDRSSSKNDEEGDP